jgi:hypothetical protein
MQGMKSVRVAAGWLTALFVLTILTGCATAPPPANVKMVDCAQANIAWDVAPEAEITNFACAFGTHEGDPSLIFTAGLKNVGSQPSRFRLAIYLLDMDKAVAHPVPLKGKPPQLAVGQQATVKIPFMKTTVMPKKILVRVTPMSSE